MTTTMPETNRAASKPPQISDMFQKFALAFKVKTFELFADDDEGAQPAAGGDSSDGFALLDSYEEVITGQWVAVMKPDHCRATPVLAQSRLSEPKLSSAETPHPHANNHPASPSPSPSPGPPRSDWYKLIIARCVAFALPTILGLLMAIFLAIPALMPPEFGLDPGSSLSSLNVSTSHVTARWNIALSVKNPSKLIAVKYTHMKILLSFNDQLALSRPSLVPAFTQSPGNVTTVRAKALSTLAIVNDLGVKGLVSTFKGGEVTIDVVAKPKRRLHLGPWWVAVFDAYFSCMGVTFTAPTDGVGRGDWMILGGTLSCSPDIITQPW